MIRRQPRSTRTDTLFPYTTLFRSGLFEIGMRDAFGRANEARAELNPRRAHFQIGGDSLAATDAAGDKHRHFVGQRRQDLLRQHARRHRRSEEHTSELQSLMRISYAVFCLKKKKTTPPHHKTP